MARAKRRGKRRGIYLINCQKYFTGKYQKCKTEFEERGKTECEKYFVDYIQREVRFFFFNFQHMTVRARMGVIKM